MITIARFVHAFFYFWVFGLISVLLDLDHIIQVYRDGLEINIENLAYHGTRTLHIPVLVLCGCLCLITAALFIRFWHLNSHHNRARINNSASEITYSTTQPIHSVRSRILLRMATNTIISPIGYRTSNDDSKKSLPVTESKNGIIVECPECCRYIGVIPVDTHAEFPCPYCGTEGYLSFS